MSKRIIETCPKCYGDLKTFILKSDLYLWRPKKVCESCGWEWIGDAESEVTRIPFDETNYNRRDQYYVEEYNPVWPTTIDLKDCADIGCCDARVSIFKED